MIKETIYRENLFMGHVVFANEHFYGYMKLNGDIDIYNKFGKYEPLKTISENDYNKKWIHKNDSNLDIMSIIEENSVMNPNMDCWTEEIVYFERKYRYDKILDMNVIIE
jgi:hypothetical protein